MFLEEVNNMLECFSRNVEGYFLERNNDTHYSIDKNYLESIKEINKEAKRILLKAQDNKKLGNYDIAEDYFNLSADLMGKKDKALSALISKFKIEPIGYHMVNYTKKNIYLLYNINGYSFHLKRSVFEVDKETIKFLGILDNSAIYKTLGESNEKSLKAVKFLNKCI